jgi:hypothetical protein
MRSFVIAAALVFVVLPARAADEPVSLLVGVWEITYTDATDGIPIGTKLELTKDGKVKWIGKDKTEDLGGYKLENGFFVLTGKTGDKNDKARAVLLNKSSLVLNDEVLDKVMVFKRVKPK